MILGYGCAALSWPSLALFTSRTQQAWRVGKSGVKTDCLSMSAHCSDSKVSRSNSRDLLLFPGIFQNMHKLLPSWWHCPICLAATCDPTVFRISHHASIKDFVVPGGRAVSGQMPSSDSKQQFEHNMHSQTDHLSSPIGSVYR